MVDLLQGADAVLPADDDNTSSEDAGDEIIPWGSMHGEFVSWCMWALANKVRALNMPNSTAVAGRDHGMAVSNTARRV